MFAILTYKYNAIIQGNLIIQ